MHRETWKKFERWCAWFIGGWRHPANTGARIDVESDHTIAQCKDRKDLSHKQLTDLSKEMELLGEQTNKLGMVLHQVPPGRGNKAVPLVTMTAAMFDHYFCLRKENG